MTASDPAETLEIDTPPAFAPGTKVRARALVRDDGTFPGARVGDVLVEPGALGYVREVGSFLQRFWIYEVDFIDSRRIVGMRAAELESAEGDRS
ncbi:nitrogen fixation protein NifZ [Roseospira visakhapatnamensis]|uniref:Nitrogen fixation protein NifZ n=1 Tax=Roseospira visakhapatnamensis TaxID=390880 RepID=A0A7W6WA05_9PROT|nr:nitrogen fixation protein NifZ [Roseospira visakhapatnamensis]MBB4265952.1 nitrogen fixation protein NifZ [Roseospira visakhapatnamensis]